MKFWSRAVRILLATVVASQGAVFLPAMAASQGKKLTVKAIGIEELKSEYGAGGGVAVPPPSDPIETPPVPTTPDCVNYAWTNSYCTTLVTSSWTSYGDEKNEGNAEQYTFLARRSASEAATLTTYVPLRYVTRLNSANFGFSCSPRCGPSGTVGFTSESTLSQPVTIVAAVGYGAFIYRQKKSKTRYENYMLGWYYKGQYQGYAATNSWGYTDTYETAYAGAIIRV